ncbi:MAG: putative exosortase B-associated extracellular polysaccharide biosynthesis transporter EpsL [Propionivibrio sp.]|nr:putative exosortase B-associated extracellular polysaccharide biosynthesis transporter EpsL [Propionivibrio sp.]
MAKIDLSRIMLAAAVTVTAPGMMAGARADQDDTVSVVAGYALRHEDNLFRLPPGADTRAATGKSARSDTVDTTSLGLRVNKRYSLQRIQLEADLIDYRYRTFDYLNFTARNYAAAWHWQLTPAFRGTLSSRRTEALNSFNDFTGYRTRNIRVDKNHRLDTVFELDGAWRLLGGMAQSERTNSETFLEESDTRLNTVEAGVRRDFTSGSALSLLLREGRGEYTHRPELSATRQLDNAFEQSEQELLLHWPVSAKTTLQGRLAHLERRHEHFPARDYSGMVGTLSATVRATDTLQFTGGWTHDLNPYQSDTSSYASTDRISLGALWRIGSKTTLRGRYEVARRDFRGALAGAPRADRSDTQHGAGLALEWQAYRAVLLSVAVEQERRDSNQSAYDFKNTTGTVSARLTF